MVVVAFSMLVVVFLIVVVVQNLSNDTISTDRYPSIKKLMRTKEEYKHIQHQFDPCHLAKNILQKLMAALKKKLGWHIPNMSRVRIMIIFVSI